MVRARILLSVSKTRVDASPHTCSSFIFALTSLDAGPGTAVLTDGPAGSSATDGAGVEGMAPKFRRDTFVKYKLGVVAIAKPLPYDREDEECMKVAPRRPRAANLLVDCIVCDSQEERDSENGQRRQKVAVSTMAPKNKTTVIIYNPKAKHKP